MPFFKEVLQEVDHIEKHRRSVSCDRAGTMSKKETIEAMLDDFCSVNSLTRHDRRINLIRETKSSKFRAVFLMILCLLG